jgi:nucleoside-diphosphate-sugar epimerase
MRVLVTGATGVVGRALCPILTGSGHTVRAALRREIQVATRTTEYAVVGEIGAQTDWDRALDGVDAVIHLAAQTHLLHHSTAQAEACLETNARGTLRLATAAARAGIRRFVYLSTIKVNGGEREGHAYSPWDPPDPQDAYAAAKWAGEVYLSQCAASSHLEPVIVRSPLIYGPGVRANFLRLMRWVDRERPLPFGAVANCRSLVAVWNLCDLLVKVLCSPVASGRTWMVSDGQNLSTPELIRYLGAAMGRRVRLPKMPVSLLSLFAVLLGRRSEMARLCGSLVLDIGATREELGWSPPLSVDEAIRRTVAWYLGEGRSSPV